MRWSLIGVGHGTPPKRTQFEIQAHHQTLSVCSSCVFNTRQLGEFKLFRHPVTLPVSLSPSKRLPRHHTAVTTHTCGGAGGGVGVGGGEQI